VGLTCCDGDPGDRYALTVDGVHIAYQVFGKGPIDLLFSFGKLKGVPDRWRLYRVVG
jgi:hypothetical protein